MGLMGIDVLCKRYSAVWCALFRVSQSALDSCCLGAMASDAMLCSCSLSVSVFLRRTSPLGRVVTAKRRGNP